MKEPDEALYPRKEILLTYALASSNARYGRYLSEELKRVEC